MAGSAVPIRVVATRSAFLFPVAGDYGGVDIKRHLPQRADFAEQPAAGFGLYPFVGQHIEAAKQSHDGLVASWPCGLPPAPHQGTVHAHRLGMCEPAGTTPDGNDELLDQLAWRITPVRLGLRQSPAAYRLPKTQAVEHLLEQGQLAQGCDLSIAETDRKPIPL